MKKRNLPPEMYGAIPVGEKPFEGDRQFVGALHRGLEILRAFRPGESKLSNLELAERTKMGNSTVSRLTYTLTALGYLKYEKHSGGYSLGISVLGLGYSCLAGFHIREVAQGPMQALADKIGDGLLVALLTRDKLQMTYLACALSEGIMSLRLSVGSRISLARSAAGRAHIAMMDDSSRKSLLSALEANTDTNKWQNIHREIMDSIEQFNTLGYCINIQQWSPDVNSAAVAFKTSENDSTIYSLNCGGFADLIPEARIKSEVGPALIELANRLEQTVQ